MQPQGPYQSGQSSYNNWQNQTGGAQGQMVQRAPHMPQINAAKPKIPLPASLVDSIGEVTPNDVTMDGTLNVFVASDLSGVVIRQWNQRMEVDELYFVPAQSKQQEETNVNQEPEDDILSVILERLEKIEKLVKRNTYRKSNGSSQGKVE